MDHLAGDMAVLLHARFDDALEDANGVFTFTHSPSGAELLIDSQPGAISVTNPPTDRAVRPESGRVTLHWTQTPRRGDPMPRTDESPSVEALTASSENP